MKYRTRKSLRRSPWSRFTRWLARVVDDLTRVDVHPNADLPGLEKRKARVWR